jgi:hypothetical protein
MKLKIIICIPKTDGTIPDKIRLTKYDGTRSEKPAELHERKLFNIIIAPIKKIKIPTNKPLSRVK